MKTAVFGDVHGNLEALEAVLADAKARGAEAFACLGDVVGYGANPNECCERVRALDGIVVRGNHDHAASHRVPLAWFNELAAAAIRWTRGSLSPENRAWLRSLPFEAALPDGSQLVHGSLDEPRHWHYLYPGRDVEGHFRRQSRPLCFVGHTHVPFVFIRTGGRIFEAAFDPFRVSPPDAAQVAVNPGGVGQPRDEDPRAAYALYDPDTGVLEPCRVEYDVAAAARKIQAAGLPDLLARRLFLGR